MSLYLYLRSLVDTQIFLSWFAFFAYLFLRPDFYIYDWKNVRNYLVFTYVFLQKLSYVNQYVYGDLQIACLLFRWLQLSSLIWSISKDIPVDLNNLFRHLTISIVIFFSFYLIRSLDTDLCVASYPFTIYPKKYELYQTSQSHQLPDFFLFLFVNLKEHKG